jgi:formylglycine-generating enzyme required for sulfatase activity/tetratricopeptide (TPR) repeat protein
MELGLNQSQLEAREAALTKEGYRRATSSHLARPDGKDRFAAIWLKVSERAAEPVGVYSGVEPEYSGDNYLADLQVDVQVSRASPPRSTKERFAEQLAEAEKQLKAKAEDTPARLRRALARLHLGDSEKALEDLSWLIGKSPKYALAYLHRAEVHSRLGKTKEAKEDLARFQELSTDAGQKAYADAVVSAFLGEDAAGMKRLEAGIAANGKDADFLYNAACACAVASRALVGKDGAKAKRYSDRALALIKEAVANGYTNYLQMQTDPNLDPLREQPAFTQLLQVGRLERHYLAVWHPVAGFRSTEVHGLDPDQHLARCRSLVTQGYRPAAISGAFVSSSLVGDDKGGGSIVSASVWHQPLVPEEHKEALAKRQANAAVALVRLGHGEKVWPLLKHSPDPRVRSGIIHRLSPMGAAPEVLAQRLDEETDVTIRRALLLSLGEYPSVSPVDQNLLAAKLLELYRDDPDPGIHGACAWVLRRWGHSTKLAQTDAELAKRPHPTLSKHSALAPQASSLKSQATGHAPQASSLKPQATGHAPQASSLKPQATGHAPQVSHPAPQASSRRWYVNSQGQTFVIIPGPVEFLMGSPRSEAERERGAEGPIERLHKKRIGRTFAIASHEVTVEQFLRFRREHRYRPQYANQPDCPMNDVSWYDAAAYCNWLSEQEGIPKDQWCYEPNAGGQYAEGMKPKPRYLQLTGYRLPSESEWEYACRSGAATARFYGETEELLGQYAWYTKNSLDRWLLPVGSLKPNEFGLFDMLGNALEWCQDPIFDYRLQRAGRSTEDQEFAGDIRDTQLRVLRGGAFSHRPRGVRSGNRLRYQPADRLSNVGFRLARTYD